MKDFACDNMQEVFANSKTAGGSCGLISAFFDQICLFECIVEARIVL